MTEPARTPDARVLDRLAAASRARPAVPPAPPPAPHQETFVAAGDVRTSFYDGALAAGATPEVVREAVKLFSGKLDFARDLPPDAPFRLVFDRTAGADGRTLATGALLYAEIGVSDHAAKFYRFEHEGRVDYLDGAGRKPRPLLLRTPVEGAHVTSGFGMRLHPILGFTRLHPGVDLGAPEGSPVLAAGDGVVEEADWAGGYGHWLKIGHAAGLETGYGHLLRYAAGVRPGAHVAQGQVVAFVGSSGLSTGPHLHFEMLRDGRKLNPETAVLPVEGGMDGSARAAFAAQRARVDGLLAGPVRLGRAVAPSSNGATPRAG